MAARRVAASSYPPLAKGIKGIWPLHFRIAALMTLLIEREKRFCSIREPNSIFLT